MSEPKGNMTGTELRTLNLVERNGMTSIGKLAELAGTTAPAMSATLRRLEAGGRVRIVGGSYAKLAE